MVEVDFSGNFTSPENCKMNDIGTFIDEGEMKERSKDNRTWNQLVITVDVNEKQLSHSFKTQEGKRFQDLYGKDTKAWIGKQFKIVHIPYVDKDKNIQQAVEVIPLQVVPAAGETEVPKQASSQQV